MAPPAGYEKPPQFEISDLKLQSSDPMWPEAVRLVQTYWKQATVMAPGQCREYLEVFDRPNLAYVLSTLKKIDIFKWWDTLHDKDGIIFRRLSWSGYLKVATLHGNLPMAYKAAIATIHGRSAIEDFTDSYRWIYPAPKETDAAIKAATTSHQAYSISDKKIISNLVPARNQEQNATPTPIKAGGISVTASQEQDAISPQRNNAVILIPAGIQQPYSTSKKKKGSKAQVSTDQKETHTPLQITAVDSSPSFTQKRNTTPAKKRAQTLPASTIQQINNPSAGTQLVSTSTRTAQSVGPEGWNIGNVVDMLGQVKKRRLSSAPESSPKRVKTNDNEVLDQVNQQATITKGALEKLQSTAEQQGAKLQEVSATSEQNKQTLNDMQSELRHFMSAVASTLRDIQERLEE